MGSLTFLKAVCDIVHRETTPTSRRGLFAARLGNIIGREFPHLHWSAFGYERLTDVLVDLANRNWVRLDDASGALCVWPTVGGGSYPLSQVGFTAGSRSAIGFTQHDQKAKTLQDLYLENIEWEAAQSGVVIPPISGFRPLKKDAWNAFIDANGGVKRYFNRTSGAIQSNPGDLTSDWIEIDQIELQRQKDWANDFFKQCRLGDNRDLHDCLSRAAWYPAVIDALGKIHQRLVSAWKRFHSRMVGDFVGGWCKKHGLDESLLFESFQAPKKPISENPRVAASTANSLRDIIFVALSKVSTETLLEIKVPIRPLIEVLRPDLLM